MKTPFRFLALPAAGALLLAINFAHAEPGPQFPPVPAADIQKMKDAAPATAPAKPLKPRKLLVFYRAQGYVHQSIPYGVEAFRILGEKTGAFTTVASDDMAIFTPQKLAEFDGVIFVSTTGLNFEDPASRKALLDFLTSGKGLMGIHAATDSFKPWPEMREILGGKFHGHPWGGGDTSAVKVDDPAHPINRAFGGKGFWIKDEIYQIDEAYSRDKQRVLLSLDMSKPQNDRSASKDLVRTDGDFPIAWIKQLPGGGRVFYSSLGHNNEIFETPEVLQHYLAGIQYALGDLKADATPSAKLSPQPVAATAGEIAVLQEKIRISSFDDLLAKFATYDFGQSREAISAISFLARNESPEGRAKIEAALLALLAKPGLSYAAKDQICRWLVLVGTNKSVASLAGLLKDEKLGAMGVYALFELRLEPAVKALRSGLSGAVPSLKPSIIGALGRLGDPASIPALAAICGSSSADDARAATIALGAIGSPAALTALGKAKVSALLQETKSWALLSGASKIVRDAPKDAAFAVQVFQSLVAPANPLSLRLAAIRGLLLAKSPDAAAAYMGLVSAGDATVQGRAASLATILPDATVAQLAAKFPSMEPATVVKFLSVFTKSESFPQSIFVEALANKDTSVQIAAINGLGKRGDASDLPALFGLASKDGDVAKAAIDALASLPGVNEALRTRLKSATGAERIFLLDIVASRVDHESFALAIAAAGDTDAAVRLAGIKAAGRLATSKELNTVLGLLSNTKSPQEKVAAEKAVVAAVRGARDADFVTDSVVNALKTTPPEVQRVLLVALAAQDTPKASAALQDLLASRPDEGRLEIIRVLSGTRNPTAATLLYQLAGHSKSPTEHALAMRGYVDYIANVELNNGARAAGFLAAMPWVTSAEERDAVVAGLTKMDNGESRDAFKKLEPRTVGADRELRVDDGIPFAAVGEYDKRTPGTGVYWKIKPEQAGTYKVEGFQNNDGSPHSYRVTVAGKTQPITVAKDTHDAPTPAGELPLEAGSDVTILLQPEGPTETLERFQKLKITRTPAAAPTPQKP